MYGVYPPIDLIVTRSAIRYVLAVSSNQTIISVTPVESVIPSTTKDRVISRCSVEQIVFIGSVYLQHKRVWWQTKIEPVFKILS